MVNSMLYPRESKTRRVVDISGMWEFKIDSNNEGRKNGYANGLKDTTFIPVPSSFNDLFTDKNIREHAGDVWYETSFYLPSEWKDKDVNVRFGCATHEATVYINGKEVCTHVGGFMPFNAPVNEAGIFGEKNKLVVVVNNELSNTTIPCGHTETKPSGKKYIKPSFDFFNYAGLNRPVKITVTNKEYIHDIDIVSDVNGSDGIVNYEVHTTGENKVYIKILDEECNEVASAERKSGKIVIKNAKLWNPKAAYLYKFEACIKNGEELIDEYYLDFGIRTVKVEGTKFLINGKPFYFTGFGKHEDSEIAGRGYNPPVIKRDFELIKWIGANSFRTSHYPYSEEIMQAADREGIVIIDEVAAVGMFDVGSVLNPGASKTDYFSLDEVHNKTKEVHKKAVEELIKRDKNHPSVVMWSLFNEPDTSKDEAVPYFEDIFNFAKSQDKQNLPKTFAAIQASSPGKCKCMHLCDVITLNRYYGWYFLGGYEIDMSEEKFREEMNLYSSMNKPVMFTEYGADTYAGVHKLPSVMWSEEYQCEYYEMNFKVFDSYDFIVGEQLWNFADFQTTEGIFRVDGNKKGIFTRNRQPKAVAHYIRNRWTKLPLDYKSKK
ncbi:beta-glucuronidase [Brachyspira hyodysenteriae]|uniref:beta-glucuronidase n=1 Tax=Brachyspira hyodysenteriae TaxID=159 RepID=UPI0011829DE6|nr:beta-glucuronidase [Brachyspira hyodysenteriae]TVL78363.1 beta-glucuronidase [Brachyspira hyodysenteriae]TVL86166.1 beta-glucuronidase [Brachyspira hyodysenteriae]